MAIKLATPDNAAAIYELMDRSRHLYTDFPEEKLSDHLAQLSAVIGEEDGTLWGFLYIERESRPVTMPQVAPNRLYLRGIVLANKRSPLTDISSLLSAALALPTLSQSDNGFPDQLIFFGRDTWPIKPLIAAGFEITEHVDNYDLNHLLRRRSSLQTESATLETQLPIALRDATSYDLDEIAALDGVAFDPHWHFGSRQLAALLPSHSVRVAILHNDNTPTIAEQTTQQIIGYTALSEAMQDLSGWRLGRKMHLARIAAHPEVQGLGIGKYLMLDILAHAAKHNIDSLMLNTQSHNERSQTLYKRYGFRRTGRAFTVLTMNTI